MADWKNADTLESFKALSGVKKVELVKVFAGENGAERVKKYNVPMAAGLKYYYAAKEVDDETLKALEKLADEAELAKKFEELYNGAVINTGEKRLVLH
ncbi:MAG: glucose-6-phosphate isomerase, partial [Lachnospiraceae bacterium]|nr:glucose-6-phosphate isomerase [Lachnospiraceae bacterium]